MWEKIGCFKDKVFDRALPIFLGGVSHFLDYKKAYPNLRPFFEACASVAEQKGYFYFGIQFHGECWGGDKMADYDRHGKVSTTAYGYRTLGIRQLYGTLYH